jgi:hypothetical protein
MADEDQAPGQPRAEVSIGLPVWNGEEYVARAMEALVAEDYSPLEIVVSDNASTDRTWEILQRFEDDRRVALHRSDENLGAVANFNRVFHLTRGPYFAWAAADDRFDPRFASRCMQALAQQPDAAGCLTGIRFVDESGETIRVWVPGAAAASADVRTRLRWYLGLSRWTESYALFRRPVLEVSGLFPAAFGPDVLLVWRILLAHRMAVVAEPLLTYQEKSSNTIEIQHASLSPASSVGRAHFCNLGMLRAMWMIAGESKGPVRRVARQELLRCLGHKTWRRRAMEDLSVELQRHQAASRQEAAPARMWRAKSRVAGIYVLMASIEPRVFVRAAARHARAALRRRTPQP